MADVDIFIEVLPQGPVRKCRRYYIYRLECARKGGGLHRRGGAGYRDGCSGQRIALTAMLEALGRMARPGRIQADVLPLLGGDCAFQTADGMGHRVHGRWDMIIAFPPCTYMANSGAVRMRVKGEIVQERYQKAMDAKMFFMQIMDADCEKIAIENPTPMKLIGLPPYTQAVQPYEFGHPYSKRTCLWLKGLPKLRPTEILGHHEPYVNGGCRDGDGNYRRFQGRKERDPKIRAKTFPGIAKAMAEQWGKLAEKGRGAGHGGR